MPEPDLKDIQSLWFDPDFNAAPEDIRLDFMRQYDPAFGRLPGIDQRRIVRRNGERFGRSAKGIRQPLPSEIAAQDEIYKTVGLPGGAPPPIPRPELQQVTNAPAFITDNLPISKPEPVAPPQTRRVGPLALSSRSGAPAPPAFQPKQQEPAIPPTKPTGVPLDIAKPGPYVTLLSPQEEAEFRAWVQQNNVPFDPGPHSDYDMRGFWQAQRRRDPKAVADGQNYPDRWKTPTHATFSADSIYAGKDAPKWMGPKLVDSFGNVIKNEQTEAAAQDAINAATKLDMRAAKDAKASMERATRLANTRLAGIFKRTPQPGNQAPVPQPPLAGIAPGMEQLGSQFPGVPAPPQPEMFPQPTFSEMQSAKVGPPKLEWDPVSGGLVPSSDSSPEQLAQFLKDDPWAVGVRGLVGGAIGTTGALVGGGLSAVGDLMQQMDRGEVTPASRFGGQPNPNAGRNTLQELGANVNLGASMITEPMSPPPDLPSVYRDGWNATKDPRWWASSIGQGIGSMVPMLASGVGVEAVIGRAIASGAIGGEAAAILAEYGPAAAGGLTEGLMAAGNTYNEAMAAGATPDKAREAAAEVAVLTAATSAAANKLGPFNDKLPGKVRVGTSAGLESVQEVAQGMGEDFAARHYDPMREIGQTAAENAVGGLFGGLAMSGATRHTEANQQPVTEQLAAPPSAGSGTLPGAVEQEAARTPPPAPLPPTSRPLDIEEVPEDVEELLKEAEEAEETVPPAQGLPVDAVLPNPAEVVRDPGGEPGVKEEEQKPREFSSTQANFPPELASRIQDLGRQIADEDLTEKGREDETHVTVKFGLHGNDPSEVARVLAGEPPIKAKLGKVSLFQNDDADVVKIEVESEDLHRLNKKIADAVETTDTHPTYKPHVTIAYVKPGLGKKYVEKLNQLEGTEVTLGSVAFSGKDRRVTEIPLGGQVAPVEDSGRSEPFPNASTALNLLTNFVRGGIKDTPALNAIIKDAGITVGSDIDQKQAYDLMEAAVNRLISEQRHFMAPALKPERVAQKLKEIGAFLDRLPTQTTRTEGQIAAQQFSTPPTLAYIAAKVAGIKRGDVVLEPSAGTGSLAAFARGAGADVVTNEIDPTRRGLLAMQGYRTFGENAEQLHNILPDDVQPDVVLMNPPFSSSVVRGVANSNDIGYAHVMQALNRLKPGGRLVAILGKGAKMGLPRNTKFWQSVRSKAAILADVGISGKEYRKYGTSFDNRLIVLQKGATPVDTIKGEFDTLEEVWNAVSSIPAGEVRGVGENDAGSGSVHSGDGGAPPRADDGTVQAPGLDERPAARNPRVARPKVRKGPFALSKPPVQADQHSDEQTTRPEDEPSRMDGGSEPGATGTHPQPGAGLTEEQAREAALKQLAEEADADIAAGEQALRDLGFYTSLGSTNLDPRALAPLVQVGVGYAKKGYISFKRWSEAMLQQFAAAADRIRPHLRDIYDRAMEAYEEAVEKLTGAFQKPPAAQQPAVQDEPAKVTTAEEDGDFVVYVPEVPEAWGSKEHKARIVETQAMAGVKAPKITVKPNIPQEVIERGDLSNLQLVAISRAAAAFQRELPNGERTGFFIGDGTGVGKGREIAGTIVHLWNSGVKRIVWVSFSETLMNAAKDDLTAVGGDKIPISWIGDQKADKPLKNADGIIFTTYNSLASMSNEDKKSTDKTFVPFRRVRQIMDWARENPGIIFDESHMVKNAAGVNSERGKQQGTNAGRAALALQANIPKAHVVYSSATGFTEPDNLIYAQRLGLWGQGTPFEDFKAFKQIIEKGGIGAMEVVARDLKAQGLYESRFISFKGVDFDEKEHPLTEQQVELIDKGSEAWRIVRQHMWKAFEDTETPKLKRGKVASQFYGAFQRFNMTVLTAMKVPTLLREIDAALDKGEQIVVSVMLTGEAAQERALEEAKDTETSLDDLDLSPAQALQDLVNKVFPTQQYETVTDENGNEQQVPVFNAAGEPVQNAEAVAAKQALLEKLSELRMPDSAIDQIINKYGSSMVAELSGRSRRIEIDPKSGQRRIVELKGDDRIKSEADKFQNGDKRIAIVSPASSTGISLHASNRAKNRGRRRHFVLQLMWSADRQMQVFGRSHRTDQAVPPHYTLLTMNVGGEKRFASSIARRLEQLGALSRGDRGASGAGSIGDYNFESKYGYSAANGTMRSMIDDDALGGEETVKMMGLEQLMTEDEEGSRKRKDSEKIDVPRFLNRIQFLPVKLQNRVFADFMNRFQDLVEAAKADGTFDSGAEKIDADEIELARDPKTIQTDAISGAKTYWYEIDAKKERAKTDWDWAQKNIAVGYKLVKNSVGNVAIVSPNIRTRMDEESGRMLQVHGITRPNGLSENVSEDEFRKWTPIENSEGEPLWNEQRKAAGNFSRERVNLIGGMVLPIYDKFTETVDGVTRVPKVKIANLKDGRRILGVEIAPGRIRQVLREIGFGTTVDTDEVFERLAAGENSYSLTNGIKLARTLVQGEHAIGVNDVFQADAERLKSLGVQAVQQNFRWKYFIPIVGGRGKAVLREVLKAYPPQSDRGGEIKYEEHGSEAGFMTADLFTAPIVALARRIRKSDRKSLDPAFKLTGEVEGRFQAGGTPHKEADGIVDRLKELYNGALGWTRTFQHLPREKYGDLIFNLIQVMKSRNLASTTALLDMAKVIGDLSFDEFEILRKAVVIDDMMETIELFSEAGEKIPEDLPLAFGWTPETLRTDQERVKEAIANHPKVAEALERRREVWAKVKTDYLAAMRSAGADVEGKLKRKNYFRHRVLLHQRLEALASEAIRTPKGRGFLKRRQYSALGMDFASNFIQTEMDVIAQLISDTRTANFISYLDKKWNIRKDLEAKAKAHNIQATMPHFQVLADLANRENPDGEPLTADDMFKRTLNRDQAIALDKFGKLAAEGRLPLEEGDKWADLIEQLATAYLSKRVEGEEMDIDVPGVIKYAHWALKQKDPSEAKQPAALLFSGIQRKKAQIKAIAGDQYKDWEDFLPEGYRKFAPDQTRAYYQAYTVPEHIAMNLMEENAEKMEIGKDDIRKVFARGAAPKEMVLDENIVKQFEAMQAELAGRRQRTALGKAARAINAKWKQYMLLSPTRAIKYTLRNQSGDLDSMLAGLPWGKAIKTIAKDGVEYQKELAAFFKPIILGKLQDVKTTPRLEKFLGFGAAESTLATIEIGEQEWIPTHMAELDAWEKNTPQPSTVGKVAKGPLNAYKSWIKHAEIANTWRELANRYTVYNVFLNDLNENKGRPTSYAASNREEVDAIEGNEAKAYRMSNDLMGAYDEVSLGGRALRAWAIPFWSYQETNFKRYSNLVRNAAIEGATAEKLGSMAIGKVARAPYYTYKVGSQMFKVYALWSMFAAFNGLFFDDDDEKLPANVRRRPHLTFGGNDTEVYYFPRLGNIADITEWIDLEESQEQVRLAWTGRKGWGEAVWDMFKGGPLEKMYQSSGPAVKYPFEALTGQTYFPDVTRPRVIESWPEKLANDFSLGEPFKALTGRPQKSTPLTKRALDLAIYRADPKEMGYYDTLDLVRAWNKSHGKQDGTSFVNNSPRTVALRNIKRSLRAKDDVALNKYMLRYLELGGTVAGFNRSMATTHPLYGIKNADRAEFIESLSAEDRRRLSLALDYHEETFLNQ